MTRPYRLRGKAVLITGAGSGIGRALAISLARRGARLVLTDIDAEGLAATGLLLPAKAPRAILHRLDVADADAIRALPARVVEDLGGLDVLINNAGIALGGTFEQTSEADFERLFDINFWGVVRLTRAFLPLLHASADARIVNLSSIFGIVSPPGQTAYSASKFAVRGFSNALAQELHDTTVGVSVVYPGGVRTAISTSSKQAESASDAEIAARQTQADRLLRMPPERAAEIILRGVERRSPRILVGRDARLAALIERLAPVGHFARLRERALEAGA